MKLKNNKKGFTLIELIIVIAVLAILAVVAIPVVNGVISSANNSVDQANVSLYNTAIAAAGALAGGSYATDKATAVAAIEANTNVKAPIPAPKTGGHFIYTPLSHTVTLGPTAGTGQVELDGTVG